MPARELDPSMALGMTICHSPGCGNELGTGDPRSGPYANRCASCRRVLEQRRRDAGLIRDRPAAPPPPVEVLERDGRPALPDRPLVATPSVLGQPLDPAQRRDAIVGHLRAAARNLVEASMLLLEAHERGDHASLGRSWTLYTVRDLGLPLGAASKMLLIARTFGGAWRELDEPDRDQLTVDRLYLSALRVRDDGVPIHEALRDAVELPPIELNALRGYTPPSTRPGAQMCVCPECGGRHKRRTG